LLSLEKVVGGWTPAQDATVMNSCRHPEKTGATGQARPGGATDADRHRDHPSQGTGPVVFDGPFAETKEQMLGFYVVNVASQDEAAAIAARAGGCEPGWGCYEIRPVMVINPVHSGLLPAGRPRRQPARPER